MRIAGKIIVLAACLWAAPVLGQNAPVEHPTPIKVETKYIEASVSILDELKAYPGLYDNLLAEGRREVARRRAEADKDGKTEPDLFATGRRYTFERGYFPRSVTGRYVSVLRHDYEDGLGAHPNRRTETILWDKDTRKRVSMRPLFKETADGGPAMQTLARVIRDAVVAQKKERDIPNPEKGIGLDNIKPKLLGIGPLALAPSTEPAKASGLSVYFSPYDVGSYAEGDYTVFVPWTAFKEHLSPQGIALFGGERPAEDAKNF